MNKTFAVFGLGRFGKKMALSLYEMGADVMVVDRSAELLEKISNQVTYAIEADLKDAEDIKGLGLENTDVVVVAMGSDLTSSIMSVMVSKEVGVPYVVAKASDERMGAILQKVGADKIIYPEEETAARTARKLMSDNFLEFFDIDDNLCLLEMYPKKEWVGKNLIELNLRASYGVNVVAIKNNNEMRSYIDPKKALKEDDQLLVIAEKDDLKKLGRK
ncbi:MAG: TrkA family potassium uptake protein [Eubacterium sp.]|nr:TrkA family potassium uptake protein [Eubacterium sp.]